MLAPTPPPATSSARAERAKELVHRRAAGYAWVLLLARIYEIFPLLCPRCAGEIRIFAFITEAVTVRQILAHLGEPTSPPRVAPARGPPLWQMPDAETDKRDPRASQFDPQAQQAPDYEFDQRIGG